MVSKNQSLIQKSSKQIFCIPKKPTFDTVVPKNVFWYGPQKTIFDTVVSKNHLWCCGSQKKSFDTVLKKSFYTVVTEKIFQYSGKKNDYFLQWSPKKIFWNSWSPKKSFETVVPKKHHLIQHIRLLQNQNKFLRVNLFLGWALRKLTLDQK